MKVAVTGGSGQLGTVVLRRLAANRAVKQIVSLDARPPAVVSAKLAAVTADVREPHFDRHLAGCDALVHLAFVVTEHLPRAEVDSINVGGSRNVFEAAAQAGVKQIVYSSSIAAYGVVPGHPVPIVESTPRRHQPGFAYAATKYEVEAFLDLFEPAHPEIAIARMRPGIFLGAGMDHQLGRSLKRRVLVDNGGAPLPLVWDEDVADAILLALQKKAKGAYNLVAEDAKTAAELAAAAGLRLVRLPPRVLRGVARFSPLLARAGLMRAMDPAWIDSGGVTMIISSEHARRDLSWQPRCRTAVDVVKRFVDTVPARLDRRVAVFFRILQVASARATDIPVDVQRLNVRLHLALTGAGGGDLGLVLEEGRLSVLPGIPRPPTVVVTMKTATLIDLLAGKMDFGTAQLTGKVRVDGEALSSLLVQGIVRRFREDTEGRGAGAFAARRLSRWFARGVPA